MATLPYQDSALPPGERAADLLGRLSLEEKVGQMCQVTGQDEKIEFWITEKHVGSALHTGLKEVIRLQGLAHKTRWGIPILFAEDAIHGHCFHSGAAIFPTQLALSCTWNEALMTAVGQATAREMTATGMFWTFSPVLCMPRDLRWGRVNETFGEDPFLIGELAAAVIRGYQGNALGDPHSVLACAKHYAGYAATIGARDAYHSYVGRRALLAEYLPPFERVARAGCATFMAGYQSNDGLPCSADRWLLRDTLCEEWGFEGVTVTDWNNVGALVTGQKVCATLREATRVAIEAGNHMIMTTPGFIDEAIALVRDGEMEERYIDDAVRRILTLKFALGLFDHKRYPSEDRIATEIGCDAHVAETLKAARESLVLLKNRNAALPLGAADQRLAVIGPNADDVLAQLGDWSFGSKQAEMAMNVHPRKNIVTLLDGIRALPGRTVTHALGCHCFKAEEKEVDAAVALARQADVVVVAVGDHLLNTGEGADRADMSLPGAQQELLEALRPVSRKLVVVFISSKPHATPWVAEEADAVIQAFNPGMRGGQAIAELLTGAFNPSGRLTISFPRHTGQMPVNYQVYPGWHTWGGKTGGYWDVASGPLWAFGEGLSYTCYDYSDLVISNRYFRPGETLEVSVTVTNTGDRDGVEVVQLYINDLVTSVTTPNKALKAFARVSLKAGEKKVVRLAVAINDLTVVLPDCRVVVEPGSFEVMVGPSSRDEVLLKECFEVVRD